MQIKKKFVDLTTGTGGVNGQGVIANYPAPSNFTPTQVASEGTDKISAYFKGIDNALGLGAGYSDSINFLVLNSSFQATQLSNYNFENSIGDWEAYSNTPGILPVDMTGGTPSITVSQTTTSGEVLDGTASLKVVKGASDLQGEGISCIANIPLGYRGQVASIQFPFRVISGSLVDGDIRFYIYDITNSQIITPTNNYCTATGQMKMTFAVPANTEEVRVGLHFSTNSTNAVTYVIDDISVGPQQVVFGPSMSDWSNNVTITPDPAAFGTVTNNINYSRLVGGELEVRGSFDPGTLGGADSALQLPAGYVIDYSRIPTTSQIVGKLFSGLASGGSAAMGVGYVMSLYTDGTITDRVFPSYATTTSALLKTAGTGTAFTTGSTVTYEFTIPVVGFSTNVVQQNATTFQISNYLVNGVRVVGTAPTSLGEYRSYLQIGNTSTYTETNGDPVDAPSITSGIKVYGGFAYTSGDPANNPSKYEIFIGKNKQYQSQWYATTGRTGFISADVMQETSTSKGVYEQYDPTTGILAITRSILNGTNYTGGGDVFQNLNDGFFDIFVSEKVIPVQLASRTQSTASCGSFSTGGGPDLVANMTLTVDASSGQSVDLWLQSDGSGNVAEIGTSLAGGSFGAAIVYIRRNGIDVAAEQVFLGTTPAGSYSHVPSSSIRWTDINPPAGSNTYEVYLQAVGCTAVLNYSVLCSRIV